MFKHSPDYQKVQSQFLEAVETFDPNAIAVSAVNCKSLVNKALYHYQLSAIFWEHIV